MTTHNAKAACGSAGISDILITGFRSLIKSIKSIILLQDHWQVAADHLMQQFKQLLQRQQQQQACMEACDADSAAPSTYQPEQLQQAEEIWHDLQVGHVQTRCAPVSALSAWSNIGCFMYSFCALRVSSALQGWHARATANNKTCSVSLHERIEVSCGLHRVIQGHLQSLVDLRQLVDGVIGNGGHPHSIDGKKLGQAVSCSNAGSSAPDSGVNIVLSLQVLDPAKMSISHCINLPCYLHTCQAVYQGLRLSFDINHFPYKS